MEEDKKTENLILGIINNEPVSIEIILSKPNFFQKIIGQKKKTYNVYPIVLSDLIKITKILTNIPEVSFDKKQDSELFVESLSLISKYADKFIEVISILLNAPKSMLLNNLTTDDILKIIRVFVSLSNVQSFLVSIALTKSASLKS